MSTTNKSTSKKTVKKHKPTLKQVLFEIVEVYKDTRVAAAWYESMIAGLEQSLQEHKRREWWKSPHHNPNQILATIRQNTSSIIEGLDHLSILVHDAAKFEKGMKQSK